jgi:2-polyprenyl-3-methyl-5-hydroxy-6-metoxy-1,4-benzoquinol methylase
MDTIKEFYEKYQYPNPNKYLDYGIEKLYDKSLPINLVKKKICIAGCGTVQPVLIAQNNRESVIHAIDVSESSLVTAKSIADKYGIKNIVFENCEFESYNNETNFDYIVATGVMHHTKNTKMFADHAYDLCIGEFIGFVYHENTRGPNKEYANYFITNEFSVQRVKNFFRTNGLEDVSNLCDEEIADRWLNPRFEIYNEDSFKEFISETKWKHSKLTLTNTDDEKLYFSLLK